MSDRELEIMEVLWAKGEPMSFGELLKEFNEGTERKWKKQTLSTFLAAMQKKGQVKASGGARKKYEPCISREEHVKEESRNFLGKYHGGSFVKMFAALNGGEELDRREADELRRMLGEWEGE